KLFFLGIEFVLNVAHQFFQNILECDHSHRAAEFIDYDGKVRVFVEEQRKQFLQRHHFRDWNQIAPDAQKIGIRVAHQRHQFLDVNQPDGVVEMTATERKTGGARSQCFLYVLLETVFHVKENDLAAWRHDVAHDPLV